jgi:hypothetical protein
MNRLSSYFTGPDAAYKLLVRTIVVVVAYHFGLLLFEIISLLVDPGPLHHQSTRGKGPRKPIVSPPGPKEWSGRQTRSMTRARGIN